MFNSFSGMQEHKDIKRIIGMILIQVGGSFLNILTNGLGKRCKLNGIEMRKFETKEELVEWIETMHLQNTNGRETEEEMFRLGIEAAIEELTEFNLFSIPFVVGRSEQLVCPNCDGEGFSGKGTNEILPCLSCFGSGESADELPLTHQGFA